MNSPFTFMAAVLNGCGRIAQPPFPCAPRRAPAEASRTERIRVLLRERGSMSALGIALEVDLERPSLVGALLKADLYAGRIFHRDGEYHWDYIYDEQLACEIQTAIRLLRKNGYSVERTSA
jgi:hypothetical protein